MYFSSATTAHAAASKVVRGALRFLYVHSFPLPLILSIYNNRLEAES